MYAVGSIGSVPPSIISFTKVLPCLEGVACRLKELYDLSGVGGVNPGDLAKEHIALVRSKKKYARR